MSDPDERRVETTITFTYIIHRKWLRGTYGDVDPESDDWFEQCLAIDRAEVADLPAREVLSWADFDEAITLKAVDVP